MRFFAGLYCGVWIGLTAGLVAADERSELLAVADGQQDASEAIQRLVNDGDGEIDFPPGNYRLTRTVEIDLTKTGYCALRGSSATRILVACEGPAFRFRGSHFKSAGPSDFQEGVWQRERMPQVVGLAIEGDHEQADGIEAVGTMQLTISLVHLRKLRHGVHLVENNRNVLIDACHIYENRGIGIYYDNVNLHQSNIVGSHISYCRQGGVVSRKGNVRNLHITGCDLESNMSAENPATANVLIDCRDSVSGTAEVAITGCTIQHNSEGPESANIRIIGRSNDRPNGMPVREGHVTITGNVLSDVQNNVWLDGCRGVTITGNTFWMGFDHNILVERSSHIVIGPNNLDRNPRYDYGRSTTAKNRSVLRECRDCTVSGLHIAHVDQYPALLLDRCDRMHLSSLTILDCEIGLELDQVTRSRVSDCFIHDDRKDRSSKAIVEKNSRDNRFDDSITR